MVQQWPIFNQYVKQVLKYLVSKTNSEKNSLFYFVYFPGQKGFKHATDSGYYGRGTYFSVSYFTIKIRLNSNAHLLI
jgi:hypothetical protein